MVELTGSKPAIGDAREVAALLLLGTHGTHLAHDRRALRRTWMATYPGSKSRDHLRAGLLVLERAGLVKRDELVVHVLDLAGLSEVADSE